MSLYDCLHVGQASTPLLFDISIRFREKSIALVGDIEKAFLNIEVEERDRDCLRFLWVEDINSKEIQPVKYKICHVPFGGKFQSVYIKCHNSVSPRQVAKC